MNNYFIRKISSKKNKKYVHRYYDKNNNIITYNSIKQYLEGIYIPPAYDDVKINKKNYFTNGLGLLLDQYWIRIDN